MKNSRYVSSGLMSLAKLGSCVYCFRSFVNDQRCPRLQIQSYIPRGRMGVGAGT